MKRFYFKRISFILFFFASLIQGQSKKEVEIIKFLESRYSGNIDSVRLFLDESFTYYHSPYVGLGITTKKTNLGLSVKEVSPFIKPPNAIIRGDVILEISNSIINNNSNKEYINSKIKGAVGDSLKIILNREGEILSSVIFLTNQQVKQRANFYIEDIKNYSDRWYDYEINIIDIFSKKNKFVVHYSWTGSLIEGGSIYSFRAIEIIKTSRTNNKIISIEVTWTEKQFIDQFN